MRKGVNMKFTKEIRRIAALFLIMVIVITGSATSSMAININFKGKNSQKVEKKQEAQIKSLKSVSRLHKGDIQYIKILSKNSIKLKWKKMNQVKKYQIQYSKSKKMTNSKLKTVKKRNSIKIYNLNKGIYYFRVRGIKGKIKGKWSKIRKVTLDSDNIDVINQINSKYNLKLSLNAKLINYEIDKLEYQFDGKKYESCTMFAKIQISDSDFKETDKIIKKSQNLSFSIFDEAKKISWWKLKKRDIIKGQDFFNTLKVYTNEEDSQGIVVRGHMEVYIAEVAKKGYKLLYICYEGA